MRHPEGAYLGSVFNLETLRQRCVAHGPNGCWHLRAADGSPLVGREANPPKIHVHKRGRMSARRVAKEFSLGQPIPQKHVVAACRSAADCVNPQHLSAMSRHNLGSRLKAAGLTTSVAKTVGITRARRARAERMTPELAEWVRQSTQSQPAIAHALGCTQQSISDVKTGKGWIDTPVIGSVFAWRPAA